HNLDAVGLVVSSPAAPGVRVRALFAALVGVALAVRTVAFAIVMHAEHVFAWLTPGAQQGLLAGLVIALAAVELPRTARLGLAAGLIMAATVLLNLAPPNPYLPRSPTGSQQAHFLNFNGLTRLVSVLWPFAALG